MRKRMQIVIEEEAVLAHGRVERLFAGVSKGRVADVVDQGQSLHQVHVQAELGRDGAGDLRHFEGVGQAVAKVIGEAAGKDLGLGFQPAKGAGVDDAVAVALKVVAIGMLGLGNAASAGLLHPHGVVGQHGESLALGSTSMSARASRSASAMPHSQALAHPGWAGCPPAAAGQDGATM